MGQVPDSEQLQQNNPPAKAWLANNGMSSDVDSRHYACGLKPKAQELLALIAEDPCLKPPPFEKLIGDLAGACSRRITIQHRLVYQVLENERVVKVLSLWSHYE